MPNGCQVASIKPGTVCWVKFPYSDCSGSVIRPVVVLNSLGGDDAIVCMITKQSVRSHYAVEVDASDMDSGIIKPGNIRPDKLFTADKNGFQTLGALSKRKLSEVLAVIHKLFPSP